MNTKDRLWFAVVKYPREEAPAAALIDFMLEEGEHSEEEIRAAVEVTRAEALDVFEVRAASHILSPTTPYFCALRIEIGMIARVPQGASWHLKVRPGDGEPSKLCWHTPKNGALVSEWEVTVCARWVIRFYREYKELAPKKERRNRARFG